MTPPHSLKGLQNQTAYPVEAISQMQNPVAPNLMFTICEENRFYLKIPECDALFSRQDFFPTTYFPD